jgi:hypothetical protein
MMLSDSMKLLSPIIQEYMDELESDKKSFINLCDLAWGWEEKRRERKRQFDQDNHKEPDQCDDSISAKKVQGIISNGQ